MRKQALQRRNSRSTCCRGSDHVNYVWSPGHRLASPTCSPSPPAVGNRSTPTSTQGSAPTTPALVFGADRRVVLTHSANLHTKQAAGFDQTLAQTTRDLGELAATLARGKTRRRLDAVQAEVHLLSKEQVRATESRRPASTVPRVTAPDEHGHRHSPSPPMPHQMQLGGLGRPSRYRATPPARRSPTPPVEQRRSTPSSRSTRTALPTLSGAACDSDRVPS